MTQQYFITDWGTNYTTFETIKKKAEKEHWILLGVKPGKWKKEWGEPSTVVIEWIDDTLIPLHECPFIGPLDGIFIAMSHCIGRLEEYCNKPMKDRVGYEKYQGTDVKLTAKEVLTEITRWETHFSDLRDTTSYSKNPKGSQLKEYLDEMEKMDPRSENNHNTIMESLKKCGDWDENKKHYYSKE